MARFQSGFISKAGATTEQWAETVVLLRSSERYIRSAAVSSADVDMTEVADTLSKLADAAATLACKAR